MEQVLRLMLGRSDALHSPQNLSITHLVNH
jgi:hypothetical protein